MSRPRIAGILVTVVLLFGAMGCGGARLAAPAPSPRPSSASATETAKAGGAEGSGTLAGKLAPEAPESGAQPGAAAPSESGSDVRSYIYVPAGTHN